MRRNGREADEPWSCVFSMHACIVYPYLALAANTSEKLSMVELLLTPGAVRIVGSKVDRGLMVLDQGWALLPLFSLNFFFSLSIFFLAVSSLTSLAAAISEFYGINTLRNAQLGYGASPVHHAATAASASTHHHPSPAGQRK